MKKLNFNCIQKFLLSFACGFFGAIISNIQLLPVNVMNILISIVFFIFMCLVSYSQFDIKPRKTIIRQIVVSMILLSIPLWVITNSIGL